MKLINSFSIVFLFFIFSCNYNNVRYVDSNTLETSSIITVKPKIVKESAFENFYISPSA